MASNTFNYPQVNWVPLFKGEKYQQWCMQMKSVFISQDLWELVQNGYEQPKDANEEATWDEAKRKHYKQNRIRDNYVLSLIYRGVDETILPTIMAATTAKEAWSILETKYRGSEKPPTLCRLAQPPDHRSPPPPRPPDHRRQSRRTTAAASCTAAHDSSQPPPLPPRAPPPSLLVLSYLAENSL
ncbi:uncharacterized protein [Spinacia oleracea]|uniref:DUF4219 domain-containing protein n=1 Tax=Spinacia oleracea TaxID=3562 RepID=A0ABM3QNI2_SPIOL|nr:uncharacterized protein LOC130461058 [Spinacia oleracea]